MKAPVFNEDFIGVHARHNDACQIDTGPLAFQRERVRARFLGCRLERYADGIQEVKIRAVARQREYKVVLENNFALGRGDDDGIGEDLHNL